MLVADRDQRQEGESGDRDEQAQPEDDRQIGLLDQAAQPVAEAGIDKGAGDDAEKGGEHVGRQSDADQSRNQVDEPERKNRHQSQNEEIIERVGPKPGLELAGKPSGALREAAEPSAGSEENGGRAERRTDHRAQAAGPGSKQKAAGDRQYRGA